jgi:hypothetical protein
MRRVCALAAVLFACRTPPAAPPGPLDFVPAGVESVVYAPDVARALDAAAGDPRLRALAATPAWRDRWLPGRLRAVAEARDFLAGLPLPGAIHEGWKTPGLIALRGAPGPDGAAGGRPETLVVKQLDTAPMAAARAAGALLGGRSGAAGESARLEYAPGKFLHYEQRGDLIVLSDSAELLRAALAAGDSAATRWAAGDAEARALMRAPGPGEIAAALERPSPGVDRLVVRLRPAGRWVEARVFGPALGPAAGADVRSWLDGPTVTAMDAVGAWTAQVSQLPTGAGKATGLRAEVAWR